MRFSEQVAAALALSTSPEPTRATRVCSCAGEGPGSRALPRQRRTHRGTGQITIGGRGRLYTKVLSGPAAVSVWLELSAQEQSRGWSVEQRMRLGSGGTMHAGKV